MVHINSLQIPILNIILIILLIQNSNNKSINKNNINKNLKNESINIFNPGPEGGSDFPDDLRERIMEAQRQKEEIELDCQEKKIYVITLSILFAFFLLLILIYTLFKCYLFCTSRNQIIRISKLGEVYLDEKYNMSNLRLAEDNNNNLFREDNFNNIDNNNDAPSCITSNKYKSRGGTFNPNEYKDN